MEPGLHDSRGALYKFEVTVFWDVVFSFMLLKELAQLFQVFLMDSINFFLGGLVLLLHWDRFPNWKGSTKIRSGPSGCLACLIPEVGATFPRTRWADQQDWWCLLWETAQPRGWEMDISIAFFPGLN